VCNTIEWVHGADGADVHDFQVSADFACHGINRRAAAREVFEHLTRDRLRKSRDCLIGDTMIRSEDRDSGRFETRAQTTLESSQPDYQIFELPE
jgi:hypothetical protein